ncbi:uncharacterized protein LOC112085331 [Eutrema salsugineum]|uniref:uncharacterized protein LOC112085331 n=1 Tax=Eutrema salsugineum TaxID=72664 RepID=UPI000CED2065|nr:uncharacterized protein LOC112085331 [Eutrema salsugineum]
MKIIKHQTIGDIVPATRAKEINVSSIQCPMLNSTNYTVWAMRMRVLLKVHKVWEVIETETGEGYKNDLAMGLIFESIPETLVLQVGELNSAYKVWNAIKGRHVGAERVREARLQTLMAEFDRLKMKDTETIDDFSGKLSDICSKSAALGTNIEESKLVKKFLKSIPRKKYIHIVASLEQVIDLNTTSFEDIVGRLKAYEERIYEEAEETQEEQSKLMYANTETQQNRCQNNENRSRGRGGRFYNRGRGRGRSYERSYEPRDLSKVVCYRCDKTGHYASSCPDCLLKLHETQENEKEDDTQMAESLLMHKIVYLNERNVKPKEFETRCDREWYLDNGASNHMTGNRTWLTKINEMITVKVRFGDDSRIDIKGKGQATEAGCDVRMREDYLTLHDREGNLLVKAIRSKNRLYKVALEVENTKCLQIMASNDSRWHARLGHISTETIQSMVAKELVIGITNAPKEKDICASCLLGKQKLEQVSRHSEQTGGEFMSQEFQTYCEEEGINRHLTAPYTPQQNDIVERRNRTLLEMTRSMLKHMNMPNYLWGEAVRHSTYLINRVETRLLRNQMPYEAFKRRKPNVEHLRVIGCVSYAKIEGTYLKKLDDKSQMLVYLGTEPGSKAYRLLEPTKRRIVVNRDVMFDENKSWKWSNSDADFQNETGTFTINFGENVNTRTEEEESIEEAE